MSKKKLWSFEVRLLRSRECGLYKAANILLGDHLSEKSDCVQSVSVEKPEKRKVGIKKYGQLKQLAESNPDSNDLYEANLLDNFYPSQPAALSDVCLFDFVKWYCRGDNDSYDIDGDNMSNSKNQKFVTCCYYFLCHLLMSQN